MQPGIDVSSASASHPRPCSASSHRLCELLADSSGRQTEDVRPTGSEYHIGGPLSPPQPTRRGAVHQEPPPRPAHTSVAQQEHSSHDALSALLLRQRYIVCTRGSTKGDPRIRPLMAPQWLLWAEKEGPAFTRLVWQVNLVVWLSICCGLSSGVQRTVWRCRWRLVNTDASGASSS